MADDLFTRRQGFREIWTVPDKIISVYSLVKHVRVDANSEAGLRSALPLLAELPLLLELIGDRVKTKR